MRTWLDSWHACHALHEAARYEDPQSFRPGVALEPPAKAGHAVKLHLKWSVRVRPMLRTTWARLSPSLGASCDMRGHHGQVVGFQLGKARHESDLYE